MAELGPGPRISVSQAGILSRGKRQNDCLLLECKWKEKSNKSKDSGRRRKDILPRKVSRAALLQFRSWSQLGDHQVEHGGVDVGVPGHLLSCSLPRCWCWISITLASTNNHVNNKCIYIPSQCQLIQEVEHQKAFFFYCKVRHSCN